MSRYPSARVKAIAKLMQSITDPTWEPTCINVDLIRTMSVASSKESEALATLRFLDLVAEDGTPTDRFRELRSDFKPTLLKLVREKYAAVFQIPMKLMTQKSVVNFFTHAGYGVDTAEYQGMLFGWFCRQAGIDLPNLPEHFKRARFDKKKQLAAQAAN